MVVDNEFYNGQFGVVIDYKETSLKSMYSDGDLIEYQVKLQYNDVFLKDYQLKEV